MIKITGNALERLIPLYERQGIEESLTEAVIKGVVKGWAHVDDAASPSCALVMHAHAGGVFWLGEEPGPEVAKAFADDLFAYESDRAFCTWMEFGNCPESMAQYILQRVPKAYRTGRRCFAHDRVLFEQAPEPVLNEGITVSICSKSSELPDEMRMESKLFWDKETDIIRNSIAAIAHDAGGKMCGLCISAAVVEGYWEIDISTGEEYRRKGVGYAMAHEYIAECLSRGCMPRWNCRRENTASYNLAQKLGFRQTNSYDLITWDRRDENNGKNEL